MNVDLKLYEIKLILAALGERLPRGRIEMSDSRALKDKLNAARADELLEAKKKKEGR